MSLDARPPVLVHATEEILEEYSFGRIYEPQLGWLEEHLLICPRCQSDLDDIEDYKVFMKAGLAAFESERQAAAGRLKSPARGGPRASSLRKNLSLHFAIPRKPAAKVLWAAALLFVLAGTAVVWRMQSPQTAAPIAAVRLMALRGEEGYVASAPQGRPLNLVFDRGDLPADVYRAELVHSSGRQAWSGSVRMEEQNLSIRVDRPLGAGAYWVRLYSSAGQLLREFGLRIG